MEEEKQTKRTAYVQTPNLIQVLHNQCWNVGAAMDGLGAIPEFDEV